MEQTEIRSKAIATDNSLSAEHLLAPAGALAEHRDLISPKSEAAVPTLTAGNASDIARSELSAGTAKLPVLFVTDRGWDNQGHVFTEKRNTDSHTHNLSTLTYGKAEVSLPLKTPLPQDYAERGWSHSDESTLQPSLDRVDAKSYADFANELSQTTEKAKSNEVLVYIHGFRTSFGKAATEAATLSEVTGKPVVLYSWPAGPRTGYTVSENNVEWSSKHFEIFLMQLKQQLGAENISLVSHSMGNRLIKWAAHDDAIFAEGFSRGGKVEHDKRTEALAARARALSIMPHAIGQFNDVQKYKEIDMISPDVDRGAFINDWSNIAHDANSARIFVSSKDQAMKLSGWLAGSPRAGSQSESPSEPGDQNKTEYPEAFPGSQIIDFTAVDKGFYPRQFPLSLLPDIGHHIPYELLRDLHNNDNAPQRQQLQKIDTGNGIYYKVQDPGH